ncbi:hypothetical protein HK096_010594 [Nowakowskiella sp. JEL0078]|nr:hypothetical protein HK096_010594 [Nowakowskiella sp. JEL0078]
MQKFGLQIPAKRGHLTPARSLTPKPVSSVFASNESDDDDEIAGMSEKDKMKAEVRLVQEAASRNRQVKLMHEEALADDPTVFDFDGVYDSFKSAELKKKRERDGKEENGQKKARYMQEILSSSKRRNLELERAKERQAQREREKEGDEFDGMEKFVTSAFKKRQEELRQLEETEKKKEEEDAKRREKDPTGFYRNILDATSNAKINSDDVEISKLQVSTINEEDDFEERERNKKEAVAAGRITLNDSEEIVDKRQLLVAGVNLSAKKRKELEREKDDRLRAEEAARKAAEDERKERELRRIQSEKLSRQRTFAASHLQEQQKIKDEEEKARQEKAKKDIASQMAKHTTADAVSDARARYLARKKAQAEEDSE